jgi:hypothetical protein
VLTNIALMCVYRQPQLDPILGLDAARASDRLPGADAIAEAYTRRRGVRWPAGAGAGLVRGEPFRPAHRARPSGAPARPAPFRPARRM